MLVTKENFNHVISKLLTKKYLAPDTETTGLRPYHSDTLFSVIISDDEQDYYFNFQEYLPLADENLYFDWCKQNEFTEPKIEIKDIPVLPRELLKEFVPLFNSDNILFLQNAKFDFSFFDKEGVPVTSKVYDTETMGRLIYNDHESYSLDSQAKREFGEGKVDLVKKYMDDHELFEWSMVPGKKGKFKNYHFYRVPFELIYYYGKTDGRLTYDLGLKFLSKIDQISSDVGYSGKKRTLKTVSENESLLLKNLYQMEKTGILIDVDYCEGAIKYETDRYQKAQAEFEQATGQEFVDSGDCLGPIFASLGYEPRQTETGKPEITDEFLSSIQIPLGETVRTYRDAYKRANTYFRSFIWFKDLSNRIHATVKQSGTKTGRMSYQDPNLQNQTSEDESPYPVRRAFIPKPNHFLLSIDYEQMELKMMLDYAAELPLIKKIKGGFDAHDSTAELTGLGRKQAKILNFGILYGMGLVKLAFAIEGATLTEVQKRALIKYDNLTDKRQARVLLSPGDYDIAMPIIDKMKGFKRNYFNGLPMVENLILRVTSHAKEAGYIHDWYGRRFYFNDAQFAYRAPNSLIQGGCADVVKVAMNRVSEYLKDKKSKLLVQIHDELLFEVHNDEWQITDDLVSIMENIYEHEHIPLTCSVAYGLKSWHDLIEGHPREHFGQEARDIV